MEQTVELPQTTTHIDRKQQLEKWGFDKVERTDKTLVLDRIDMPWLPKDETVAAVPLVRVTLPDGQSFFCGSAIKGDALVQAASELGNKSDQANSLYYTAVQRHRENPRLTKSLDHAKTKEPIFYASNGRGAIRTYFTQHTVDGQPAFLRIAACSGKNSEINDVLPVLTTQNRKDIKKQCLGK